MAGDFTAKGLEPYRNDNTDDPYMELQDFHPSDQRRPQSTSQMPLMGNTPDAGDHEGGGDHEDKQSHDNLPKIPPRRFERRKQMRSLLLPQSLRWLGTVVIAALLMLTMKAFEDKGNFSHRNKLLYNVLFTGFSVGLGINFFVSNTYII